ncbi:unnamed protein product [Closterium sp. NIES-54]
MKIARTSMIHTHAPHFLWPYTVRYAAHQLNLWPHVSRPGASPTSLWTRSPGVASKFRVWGCLALVCDNSANKLSACALPCVFLGFPVDSSDHTFYHLPCHRFMDSRDIRFDESVSYYIRYPCRGFPVPPLPFSSQPLLLPLPLLRYPRRPLSPQRPLALSCQVAVDSGGVSVGGTGAGGASSEGAGAEATDAGGASSEVLELRVLALVMLILRLLELEVLVLGSSPHVVPHDWTVCCPTCARPSSPFDDLRTVLLRSSPRRSPPQSLLSSPPESSHTSSTSTPITDYYHATRPVVTRVLASLVTDPRASPLSVSALTATVSNFATTRRLDYATRVVAARPLSAGGEFAFGYDILEDRQFELEFLATASPHLCAMVLYPEGDFNAFDIPIPRTYRTYIDAVPSPGANVVDGMWIFKARYVARGFS